MTRQSRRSRQKNKRGDRKGESNDSPEIRRKTFLAVGEACVAIYILIYTRL